MMWPLNREAVLVRRLPPSPRESLHLILLKEILYVELYVVFFGKNNTLNASSECVRSPTVRKGSTMLPGPR